MRFVTGVLLTIGLTARADAQPPAKWVAVSGQVVLPAEVAVPKQKQAEVAQDKPHCLKDGPLLDERVVVGAKSRGVRDVVVWLRPDRTELKAKFAPHEIHPDDAKRKPRDVVVEMKGCRFVPHVSTARVGDTVVVRNADPIAHNFYGSGQLEIGTPVAKQSEWRMPKPLIEEATTVYDFKCTIHPWMGGAMRVFDHPYYAVTDADGKFEIRNAPAGKYRLVFWHENVGIKGGKDGRAGTPIEITARADNTVALTPTPFDVTK